jgi:ABC-type sugar transport system ATPase subunit
VIISHNLPDVFEVATRITVLRLGRNVVVFERGKTTQDEVVRAITLGAPLKSAAGKDTDEGLPTW